MTNYYYATTRSNFFAVKDITAFKAWAERLDIDVIESEGHPQKVAINRDEYGWPTCDEHGDIDLASELARHLAKDQVAVLMEIVSEEPYFTAYAIAVDSIGRVVAVTLDDIYELARKEFGSHVGITEVVS